MIGDEKTRENLLLLINAMQKRDEKIINNVKYEILTDCSDLFELVGNYIFLSKLGIYFDFGKSILKKGTKLYRIRRYSADIDFAQSSQWEAPPSRPQNRANEKGEEALYLGSDEQLCLLETHIERGQKYALGVYECIEDITLGGFFELSQNNLNHNIAGNALNAFLIAPSRNETNKKLFEFLDNEYGEIGSNELRDWKNTLKLPFVFAVMNKRNLFYNLSNKICAIMKKSYASGIRYSSCYMPIETLGIESTAYNVVLYKSGIDKVKFLGYEIKTNNSKFTDIDIVKIMCEIAASVDDQLKRRKYIGNKNEQT